MLKQNCTRSDFRRIRTCVYADTFFCGQREVAPELFCAEAIRCWRVISSAWETRCVPAQRQATEAGKELCRQAAAQRNDIEWRRSMQRAIGQVLNWLVVFGLICGIPAAFSQGTS